VNKEFLKYISAKLKTGNLRSIHLNALPNRYATRLDICLLDGLNKSKGKTPNLSEDLLLNNLLSKPTFKFEINLQKQLKQSVSIGDNKAAFVANKLNAIYNQNEDGYLEHGVKTFGFGYPVLVKRSKTQKDKIIKAPLLIWSLEIERSPLISNHWTIRRTEDAPIYINEVLLSHLAQDEQVFVQGLDETVLEDDLISAEELQVVVNTIMKQLGEEEVKSILIKPCFSTKQIEKKTQDDAWILWSGIFGLFKTQKQSIIKDAELLLKNSEKFLADKTGFVHDKYSNNCSVETDPSQEAIVQDLGSTEYKIIQGPPGTGKSQSLTAVISNALENGQKILVVCEKRTALTVVYENLKKAGLGHLAVVIDDINKDRRAIVNLARGNVSNINENGFVFNETAYNLDLDKQVKTVKEINQRHVNLMEPFFNGKNLKQIIAEYLSLTLEYETDSNPFKEIKLALNDREFNEIEAQIEVGSDCYQEIKTKCFDVLKPIVFKEAFSPNSSDQVLGFLEREAAFFNEITKGAFFVPDSVRRLKTIPNEWSHSIEYYNFRMYMMQVEETFAFWQKMSEETQKVNAYVEGETVLVEHPFFQQIKAVDKFQIKTDRFLTDLTNILACLHKIDEASKKVYLHLGSFSLSYKKRSFWYKLFSKKRTAIYDFWETTLVNIDEVNRIFNKNEVVKQNALLLDKYLEIGDFVENLEDIEQRITTCLEQKVALNPYYQWKHFIENKEPATKECLLALSDEENAADWKPMFQLYYLDLLIAKRQKTGFNKNDGNLIRVKKQTEKLRKTQKNKILKDWQGKQKESVDQFNTNNNINWLFNHRKNTQYSKRNSLRKILHEEFELFTNLFPVLLVNPLVCSSILPLERNIFDIVLFDEASQLRIEDTFAAMVRGKIKIISGDKHQMPPSSYFSTDVSLDVITEVEADGIETEENYKEKHPLFLAQSESLLDFGNRLNPNLSDVAHLDFHYRSKHPFLIDFSNAAFYGNRLVPMPTKESYKPIRCFQVNGVYSKGKNELEAQKIVDFIRCDYPVNTDGSYPSLGIATFNLLQRDLILAKINQATLADESFRKKMYVIDEKAKWFVKNLENIQGDERDVILLSTTFGSNPAGEFRQNFGKIGWSLGYRLLNVIITRAKQRLLVFTSIPETVFAHKYESELLDKGNTGKELLYAYIDYCKAIEEEDDEKRERILTLLSQNCQQVSRQLNMEKTVSSFEEILFEYLTEYIHPYRIKMAYSLGGFVVDFVLFDKAGNPIIAIDCDGATHHQTPLACCYDLHRQKIMEDLGLKYYRIWSAAWWPDPHAEIQKLLDFIEEIDATVFNWVK